MTFPDPGCPSTTLAEIVELRPPDYTTTYDLDRLDDRGVEREDPLYPSPTGELADGEGLTHPAILPGDADALEDLDPLLVALAYPHIDPECITRREIGEVITDLLRSCCSHYIHCILLEYLRPASATHSPAASSFIRRYRSQRSGRFSRVTRSASSCRHASIRA